MDPLQIIILAIIQGLLEWLPISSEGQLILLMHNFSQISLEEALSIAFFLHLGTAAVVLIRFREEYYSMGKETLNLIKRALQDVESENQKLLRPVILTTIGTAITAVPIVLLIKDFWQNEYSEILNILIGGFLLITGVLLTRQKTTGDRNFNFITDKEALILGLVQGFASLPGISRSGVTITFLLYISLKSPEALRGSFIVSVPAIIGAVILDLLLGQTFDLDVILIFLAITITFIVGWLSMDLFLRFSRKFPFGTFCISLGLLIIVIGVVSLVIGLNIL
ncbi:MAG: undecaprenyl-diphosphate phosphatase [Promethearchaeota archaeon]